MRAFVVAEAIDLLSRTPGGCKLVIIDACYSGKAASSLLARGSVDLDLPEDICVMFSTDPFTAAQAGPHSSLSRFTQDLAETLIRGLPGRGPALSVRSIYSHLRQTSQSTDLPQPALISTGTAAETITFRNVASWDDGSQNGTAFAERVATFWLPSSQLATFLNVIVSAAVPVDISAGCGRSVDCEVFRR